MLRTLSLRDFVIVDTLELDFSGGFTVLTGETGAGKSILLDALGLLLGGRGDASMVREGANKTEITAEFTYLDNVSAWLSQHEISCDDDFLLIRRTIDQAGRSKAWLNGTPCTSAQLREIGEMLVDIHGQHAHQSLLKADAQRALLDQHGGLQQLASEVQQSWQAWQNLKKQREAFEQNTKAMLQERERLEWQVGELDKLAVQAGEWEEISQEQSRLAHAASLLEGAQESLHLIDEGEHPLLSQLRAAHQRLSKLQAYDANLASITETLESACIQLQECSYSLHTYLDKTELDPQRLRAVEQRVDAIHGAARRLHVAPENLHVEHASLSQQLQELAKVSDVESLQKLEQQHLQAYRQLADQLSAARHSTASSLSQAVSLAMQELSMRGGQFAIALHAADHASYGMEQVEFLVAGHAGVSPRPLAKVASGGELARISLAIAVITASAAVTPTLVFDEVDSGIGGAVAEVVGQLLKRLGQERQVLCVTHLPQVASQANQHFQVSKRSEAGSTRSQIELLDHKQRIEEIARMLGGVEITATTRKHARELLAS